MIPFTRFAALALVLAIATPAFAQEQAASAPDRQAITDLAKRHDEALNRKDAAAAASVFTDDALVLPPGPLLVGREAIQKDMEKGISVGLADHATTVDQIHVAGDIAWTTGTWSATGPGPANSRRELRGNYSTVEQRDGGGWKVRSLTWNLIMPSPASAQSARQ